MPPPSSNRLGRGVLAVFLVYRVAPACYSCATMNPTLIALLGSVVVLATACTGPLDKGGGPSSPILPSEPPVVAPPPQARPTYAQAQKLSDQIKVGMPQSSVESMLGPPDKAGYKTYGSAAGTPWRALEWEWIFKDVTPPRVLSIVFQEARPGQWLVNHGDWP